MSRDSGPRMAEVVRAGVRAGFEEYRVIAPPSVYLTAVLPRAQFQCLFFALLGRAVGGSTGEVYALVGATPMIAMLSTVVGITHLTSFDFATGTFWRSQRSALPAIVPYALRSTPWLVEGAVNIAGCAIVTPLLVGRPELVARLLGAWWVYLAVLASTLACGLPLAVIAAAYAQDVLVSNTASYAITVGAGLLVPVRAARYLADSTLVPTANAVRSLREIAGGRSVDMGAVAREWGCAAIWGALGVVLVGAAARRWALVGRVETT